MTAVLLALASLPTFGQETLAPNPFSPSVTASRLGNTQPGLAIRLPAPADSTSPSYIRVHIFGTDGTMVRSLQPGAWVHPEGTILYWDGYDDEGHMVRNGRYIVVVQWSMSATAASVNVNRHSVLVFK